VNLLKAASAMAITFLYTIPCLEQKGKVDVQLSDMPAECERMIP